MNSFEDFAVIEMPQGTILKYEADKRHGGLMLDRVLNQPVPFNYGYVNNTLCGDGDPLDIFILGDTPIYPLTKVKFRPIGVLKCVDNGDSDDKIIAVLQGEDFWANGAGIGLIKTYLETYKKGFQIVSEGGLEEAIKVLNECRQPVYL